MAAAPENATSLLPSEARSLFRLNEYHGSTAGFCSGYLQASVTILPSAMTDNFHEFCRRNYAALPLLYRSKPGELNSELATDSDIRSDAPRYRIYSKGHPVEDTFDILGFSLDDYTSFYVGCSFSWENALQEAGLELRNITERKTVSMYKTNISTHTVGGFSGLMTVSMRPFPQTELEKVFEITAQFPEAHGAPIHIGDPSRIGVKLNSLYKGDLVEVKDGEVPVFWACAITNVAALANAKPQLAFTHYPGSMFITDQPITSKPLASSPRIIQLSREGAPLFTSVLGEHTLSVFERLEAALLDDPGNKGVAHLLQESDLLRATLALSHSSSVAVTTGFPSLTQYEIKEVTDGLPGALAICHALLRLGKKVTLIVDHSNATLFNLCTDYMSSIDSLTSKISVLLLENVQDMMRDVSQPVFDCLVAVGRAGRNKDGSYMSTSEVDCSKYVNRIDNLFLKALEDPQVLTIGVGGNGNEVGMGKVTEAVNKHITGGSRIGCVVPTDYLITTGVSNWGGDALAAGLYAVSQCQLHWRYRHHGVNAETPPTLDINNFVNTERLSSILHYMNSLGVRDTVTKTQDQQQSVNGLPLTVHVNKMVEIINIVCQVTQ